VNAANMIEDNLEPQGVAVVLRAEHTCMSLRGVKAPGAVATTSCLRGAFKDDARCRAEFLALAGLSGVR
jgi:GTP cyclohydrolase I